MIISMPDGKEVKLKWAGQVGQWEIALPKRESLWQRVNDAGLDWYFQMSQQKSDPHHATRSVRDYPWQSPDRKNGGHAPCIGKRKSDNKELATIAVTRWERRQGFMKEGKQWTLFHTGYWHNVKTGEARYTNEARPYATTDTVCKQFAVASMEYQQRKFAWSGLKWRILPVDEDMAWVNQQQIDHSGRYASCVFDLWD